MNIIFFSFLSEHKYQRYTKENNRKKTNTHEMKMNNQSITKIRLWFKRNLIYIVADQLQHLHRWSRNFSKKKSFINMGCLFSLFIDSLFKKKKCLNRYNIVPVKCIIFVFLWCSSSSLFFTEIFVRKKNSLNVIIVIQKTIHTHDFD